MYEIEIDERKHKILDYYELNGALEGKTVSKEDFYKKKSENIEKVYDLIIDFGKEEDEEKIKKKIMETIIKTQMKIDKLYDFLIKGNGEFVDYYKKLNDFDKKASELIIKMEDGDKFENGICLNIMDIKDKINNYNRLDSFYYMAFTVFFLEEYLLVQLSIFPENYKAGVFNKNEIIKLHRYFLKIFSNDFSESFKIFEMDL